MMKSRFAVLVLVSVCWLDGLFPAVCVIAAPAHPLLYAAEGAKEVLAYDVDGKVVWECPAAMSRDAWRLSNGNTLFAYNEQYDSNKHDNPSGVREVAPDGKVVFDFKTTGQVWSCQRLADGRTLVGDSSQGKILLVDAAGTVVRMITVRSKPGHSCLRNARQIANGHILVAEEGEHCVREYTEEGALVHEISAPFPVYSAVRLPNGNTVVCGSTHIAEFDSGNVIVWKLDDKDVPSLKIRYIAGLQVLPNGNLLICNAGGGTVFAEINRNKEIVWKRDAPAQPIPFGHGIQVLDVAGDVLK